MALIQYVLLRDKPYAMTSDELLLAADLARFGEIDEAAWAATPRACLRASPLVKRHRYGLHHDADQRIALVSPGTERYRQLLADPAVRKKPALRNAARRRGPAAPGPDE